MNEGVEPQQILDHTSIINKFDIDTIGATLLRIEEDLKHLENIDNIDNIDNYQRHL